MAVDGGNDVSCIPTRLTSLQHENGHRLRAGDVVWWVSRKGFRPPYEWVVEYGEIISINYESNSATMLMPYVYLFLTLRIERLHLQYPDEELKDRRADS